MIDLAVPGIKEPAGIIPQTYTFCIDIRLFAVKMSRSGLFWEFCPKLVVRKIQKAWADFFLAHTVHSCSDKMYTQEVPCGHVVMTDHGNERIPLTHR